MTRPVTDQKGFTLVEILVALAVSATVLVTLFTAFRTFSTSAAAVRRDIEHQGETRPGLTVMMADLEQVFIIQPPRYQKPAIDDDPDIYRFEVQKSTVDGRIFSRVGFASRNHLFTGKDPGGRVVKIDYYVHRNGDRFDLHRSERVIDRPDRVIPFETRTDPCLDPVLFKNIQAFVVTCTDENKEEHRTWSSDDNAPEFTLPVRVTLAVEAAPKAGGQVITTAVALPVSRQVTP
jgi:type II secretion system protein J